MFRRRPTALAPANVPPDWAAAGLWREWESPKDLIRGELDHAGALEALAGRPRQEGWLVPVAANLVRDLHDRGDPHAILVEVAGRQVGRVAAVLARQLAPRMDRGRIGAFEVCAVIRGGTLDAPGLGVKIWLGRRPAPGPDVILEGRLGDVPWPPEAEEGRAARRAERPLEAARH